jgi:hypothetical protein
MNELHAFYTYNYKGKAFFMDNQTFFNIPIFSRLFASSFPSWLVLSAVVGLFVFLALFYYWIIPFFIKGSPHEDSLQFRAATILVSVVGAFYAMLFGFVNINLWQNYHRMQDTLVNETNALSAIILNSRAFSAAEHIALRQNMEQYIYEVRVNEWPLMNQQKTSPKAWALMDNFFTILQKYEPTSSQAKYSYPVVLNNINSALIARRARVAGMYSFIPSPLFRVLAIGSLLLIFLLSLLTVRAGKGGYLLFINIMVNILIAFNLYLVLDLDNVFSGRVMLNTQAFSEGILGQLRES